MNSNDKKALKSGFWYTVSSFITKGSAIITTPIFARLLTKSDLGIVSNFSAWVLLLTSVVTFDFYLSIKIARFDYEDELDKYCSSVLVYSSSFAFLFYIIAFIFRDTVCNFLEINEIQLHIMFLYFLIDPALSIYQAKNYIYYKYKEANIVSLGVFFLSVSAGIVMVLLSDDKATGRIIGGRGTEILVAFFLYIYLLKKGGGVSPKYLKYALMISFPLIWHTLSMHLLSSCDRIVITKYIGAEAAALYAVAYTSSHAISVFYHSMNNAWSPWALVQIHEGNSEKHKKTSVIYVFLFFVIMVGLLLVSPEILMIMGGKKYLEAVNVMPPALLAVSPQMMYSLYINAENYLKKQSYIAIGTAGAALLNLGLNIVFIPKYGYVAAAYTTYVGYFALYLFHYVVVLRLGMKRFYNNKLYLLLVLISAGLIPVSTWLYGHTTLRYCVIIMYFAAIAAAAFRFKDRLWAFVSSIMKRKKPVKEKL